MFDEVQFPPKISFGSTFGPRRRTEIARLGSGAEERNAVWANSRREGNAGVGIKSHDDIHAIIAFFEARNGRLRGFRFKDWSDYKSCPPLQTPTPVDQLLGVGDGTNDTFQLVKHYTSGAVTWTRTINKPVGGTVRVAVDAVERTAGEHFNVNHATGIVTFTEGNIPTEGESVTAGYEFDVPVRFDIDYLAVNLSFLNAGEVPDVPVIEIRV